jgi:hypothetical protein
MVAATDPNLFHLDWERTLEALAAIVVLAFLLERALSVFFENRLLVGILDRRGLKELIALGVAGFICAHWELDVLSIVILTDKTSLVGELITAAVIAGGSKGAIKLFHDVLGWKSDALKELEEEKALTKATAAPKPPGK